MSTCKPNQIKLCGKKECKICFDRSFASYTGKTKNGKLKVECFDYEKNKLEPYELATNTNKEYLFKCDICEHNFLIRIRYVVQYNGWCQYCANRKLCNDDKCKTCFNKSFASYDGKTCNGKLKINCWNSKNNDKPINILKGSSNKYWFTCDCCNHDFEKSISSVTGNRNSWCPYCSIPSKKICIDNCTYCYNKSLASYLGKTNSNNLKINCINNNIIPRYIIKKSQKKYYFTCDICKHIFIRTPYEITIEQLWCPFCSNQKLCSDNNCILCFNKSFASYSGKTKLNNKKINYWDNNIEPINVFKKSSKKYLFKCDICSHKFESSPYIITILNCWCPYCCIPAQKLCDDNNCKLCLNNSFASYNGKTILNNLKINCWDIKKNNLIPRNIFIGTDKKYWFICDKCNHSFNSMICHITNPKNNTWCPYCSNQKICNNYNCNYCYDKTLANYKGKTNNNNFKVYCWDKEKNKIDTNKIFMNTNKKYWFICDICNHNFEISPTNIKNNRWCPLCKHKTEKFIYQWLKQNYKYKISYQPKYNWCKNEKTYKYLPFDFSIEELNLIIEVDGNQHFEQIMDWNSPEKQFETDKYKIIKALKNNYTVIRILQVDIYKNINNWSTELHNAIKLYKSPELVCIGCITKYKKYMEIKNT